MKRSKQRVMHFPCGRVRVLANGMCATCYTLRRQDDECFGYGWLYAIREFESRNRISSSVKRRQTLSEAN